MMCVCTVVFCSYCESIIYTHRLGQINHMEKAAYVWGHCAFQGLMLPEAAFAQGCGKCGVAVNIG